MKIRVEQIDPAGLDEAIRDTIGVALAAGTGITVTVNDAGDTITVASTVASYSDEQARDAIAAALIAGGGVTVTVNDAGDTITVAGVPGYGLSFWDDVITSAAGGETGVTLGATPISRSERVWLNATLLDRGVGYTISGASITLAASVAAGDKVRTYYATTGTPSAGAFDALAAFYAADYTGAY